MKEKYLQIDNNGFKVLSNSKISKAEDKLGKDLAYFDFNEIIAMFKDMKVKVQTASSYMAHIKKYKNWYKENIDNSISMEIPNVNQLREEMSKQEYVIVNDDDIKTMCEKIYFDDSDMNAVMFIRLFWEIDGLKDEQDVLDLKITDFNFKSNTVTIKGNKYKLSQWLCDLVYDYANMDKLVFQGKKGSYKIYTAEENLGYIFRKARTKNTEKGTHIDKTQLACLLYQYSGRRLNNSLCLTDLRMSLALRHMVLFNKTPQEMLYEKKYFNMLAYTSIYEDVYNQYSYKFRK